MAAVAVDHHATVKRFLDRNLAPGDATGASDDYVDRLLTKYKKRAKATHDDWRELMYAELGGEEFYVGKPYFLRTNVPAEAEAEGGSEAGGEADPAAPPPSAAGGGGRLRPVFLSGVGLLYLIAFLSYYLQFPGLFGEDGIQPLGPALANTASRAGEAHPGSWEGAARLLQRQPTLLWLAQPLDLALDATAELAALLGCLLSVVALLGGHHAFVFVALYALYLSLYLLGQSMLSFQWDIFLLETGFATILYAPLWGGGRSASSLPPVAWLLRFQLFKIMFMSGIVKTQANCPTWKGLTALEYHFASQCLPTAEGWWAHQLPPFFLRLGVAATFVTQIPAPFLLLAPSAWCRRLGVLAQAPLQLLIMLTGNYNWFNLHVLLLCLPCWEADTFSVATAFARSSGSLARVCRLCGRFWVWAWLAGGIGFMGWAIPQLLSFDSGTYTPVDVVALTTQGVMSLGAADDWAWTAQLSLQNKFTVATADQLLKTVMPLLIQYLFFVAVTSSGLYVLGLLLSAFCLGGGGTDSSDRRDCSCTKMQRRSLALLMDLPVGIAVCYAATLMVLVAVIPLGSMNTPVDSLLRSELPEGVGARVIRLHSSTQAYSVTSGYGLFRRMTGVGPSTLKTGDSGWGGQPMANVAVPAIVLEGTSDGKTWKEIPFRYVQGDPLVAPRRVAPMQPRLDWRMWFAALGAYQHDPWIVHLGAKLMAKAPGVIALMDSDRYPFHESPPIAVRSMLYHWDFTRMDTPWARDASSAHGTQIINATEAWAGGGAWWQRTKVGEYAPALQLKNPSVVEFMGQFGWSEQLKLPERESPCTYSGAPAPPRSSDLTEMSELALPAKLIAYILSDHPEQFGLDLASAMCGVVVAAREAAVPLRSAVGWTIETGGPGSALPVVSKMFVDAHLVALLVIVFGCLGCKAALRRVASGLLGASKGGAAAAGATTAAGKVKEE